MITIQTSTSKIVNNDGSNASGNLIITPNDEFNYLEGSNPRKISVNPLLETFSAGLLGASFTLAPTLNASQDKSNLYYKAIFVTQFAMWTEYWVIDAAGPATLEITAITKVIPDPVANTLDFISSDTVSVTPGPNLVPRAGAGGTIDPGWLLGIPGANLVQRYIAASFETLPTLTSGVLAIGYTTDSGQVFVWAGSTWRAFA